MHFQMHMHFHENNILFSESKATDVEIKKVKFLIMPLILHEVLKLYIYIFLNSFTEN